MAAAADAAAVGGPLVAVAADPTDRRAPEDVGGRLDVTKGWTLSIPSPTDSSGRMSSVVGRQAGAAVQPTSENITPESVRVS